MSNGSESYYYGVANSAKALVHNINSRTGKPELVSDGYGGWVESFHFQKDLDLLDRSATNGIHNTSLTPFGLSPKGVFEDEYIPGLGLGYDAEVTIAEPNRVSWRESSNPSNELDFSKTQRVSRPAIVFHELQESFNRTSSLKMPYIPAHDGSIRTAKGNFRPGDHRHMLHPGTATNN